MSQVALPRILDADNTLNRELLSIIYHKRKSEKKWSMDAPRSKQHGRSALIPLIARVVDKYCVLFTLLVYVGVKTRQQ